MSTPTIGNKYIVHGIFMRQHLFYYLVPLSCVTV